MRGTPQTILSFGEVFSVLNGWMERCCSFLTAHLAVCGYRWASTSRWNSRDYVECFFIFPSKKMRAQHSAEYSVSARMWWLLFALTKQNVLGGYSMCGLQKEQTLIIFSAQCGSGHASGFIRGCWLFVKPFNVPDNQPHIGALTATSFFFLFHPSSSSFSLVWTAKGEAGPELT